MRALKTCSPFDRPPNTRRLRKETLATGPPSTDTCTESRSMTAKTSTRALFSGGQVGHLTSLLAHEPIARAATRAASAIQVGRDMDGLRNEHSGGWVSAREGTQ